MATEWHQANSDHSTRSAGDLHTSFSSSSAFSSSGQVDSSPVGIMFLIGLISACFALLFDGTLSWFFATVTAVLFFGLLKEKYLSSDEVTFIADVAPPPEEVEPSQDSGNQNAVQQEH